jgi:hypothetical protein
VDILEQFIRDVAYKFAKGYPDMNNDQDVLLLESLISEIIGGKFSLIKEATPLTKRELEKDAYYLVEELEKSLVLKF